MVCQLLFQSVQFSCDSLICILSRVEKEARRKIKEPAVFYKIDDPHRIQDDPPYPYKLV